MVPFWVRLLLGLALTSAIAAQAEPQTITFQVILIDDKFVPDHLTLRSGAHYRLHLENRGKHTHEFTAPMFFGAAEIDNPDVLNRERTEVLLQPGESKYVFLTIHRLGAYDLTCADHDWEGMIGGITVE